MSAPFDDFERIAEWDRELTDVKTKLKGLNELPERFTPADLQAAAPRGVFEEWTEEDCKLPFDRVKAEKAKLEKKEEILGERLVAAEHRAKDLRDKAVSLADLPNHVIGGLLSKFRLRRHIFDESSSKLSTNESTAKARKDKIAGALGNKCIVCGLERKPGENNVSVAHILKTREAAAEAGFSFWNDSDHSNWLLLCGTKGAKGSCHNAFDTGRMSFKHLKGRDSSKWVVVGGDWRHGLVVTIKTHPHRRALHAHLVSYLAVETLDIPKDGAERSVPENVDRSSLQFVDDPSFALVDHHDALSVSEEELNAPPSESEEE